MEGKSKRERRHVIARSAPRIHTRHSRSSTRHDGHFAREVECFRRSHAYPVPLEKKEEEEIRTGESSSEDNILKISASYLSDST